ncbi:MAG: hypothetical protein IJH71_05635 [Eubacterium sp.]|nr:hypothetical protein [Eubacterium sp.]
MPITVTEEGIASLKNLRNNLESTIINIVKNRNSLKATFDANKLGLGAHTASIQSLLDAVADYEEDGNKPVKKLVLKINRSVSARRQHIDEDRLKKRR